MLGSIDKKKGHYKSNPKPITQLLRSGKGNTGNCKATGKVTIQENTYFFWWRKRMGHASQQAQTQSMDASGGGSLAAAGTSQSLTRYGVAAYYRMV